MYLEQNSIMGAQAYQASKNKYDRLLQVLESSHVNKGNILGANQPLRANRANFNLGHQINIQGDEQGKWEGEFAKV